MFGFAELPTVLQPQEEMQFAQLWHSIVAFAFMAIIIAHIYLGSVGMEGAFEAMGTGEVDAQWAKEHHNLWYEEVTGRADPPQHAAGTPAE
jgi:formate dehydrogenase subunit gamma